MQSVSSLSLWGIWVWRASESGIVLVWKEGLKWLLKMCQARSLINFPIMRYGSNSSSVWV